MAWARVDDGFHDHPKVIGLPLDVVGLWTLCLTWANRHLGARSGEEPGRIPPGLPNRFASPDDAVRLPALLVAAGLWDEHPDGGWIIHDFVEYLPADRKPQTADQVRAARSEAGKRGAAARWGHAEEWQADGKLPSDSDGKPMPPSRPVPSRPSSESPDGDSPRHDVEAICAHLAQAIEANGSKRPTITKRWRTSARLLIDADGRTVEQVHAAIDWCQADTFWRSVILSMPKLREKYDQIRLAAQRQQPSSHAAKPSTTDERVAATLELAARYAAAEGTTPPAIGA